MSGKIDDDDDFDAVDDDELMDDFEEIDDKPVEVKVYSDARRKLEQLREEKELERLINGDMNEWF